MALRPLLCLFLSGCLRQVSLNLVEDDLAWWPFVQILLSANCFHMRSLKFTLSVYQETGWLNKYMPRQEKICLWGYQLPNVQPACSATGIS